MARDLLRDSGAVLLDIVPSAATTQAIRRIIETGGDEVCDLHLWRVGPGHMAAVVSMVSRAKLDSQTYKQRLATIAGLSHVNVEVIPAA
ncbi:hypothetical protein [Mangrovibrevibacter kandeliae]|uniref:hypothetical protein n=1 Tax=Mangrovibrevibacter kandeliae TaxID=2968473 RepID=UPI00389B0078